MTWHGLLILLFLLLFIILFLFNSTLLTCVTFSYVMAVAQEWKDDFLCGHMPLVITECRNTL